MNIQEFFLLSAVYFMVINTSFSKSVYESKSSSETEEEKISSPQKRKVQNVAAYVDTDAIDQKADRYSRVVKMPLQEDDDNRIDNRFKADTLRKRTLFDSNFPYGVVYGNGRPIGILKPYPQSFELAPIREIRVPTSERYVRSLSSENEGEEIPMVKQLQDDAQYTNDKYPEILTNFKIKTKVRKVQEQRGGEIANRKREEAKHTTVAPNKMINKRNVKVAEPQIIDEIEDSLKHIVNELGLYPDEKLNKRETNANTNEQEINEDEDLETGSNKIDIHKESHDNARTKKEGKHKNTVKKKVHTVEVKESAPDAEDREKRAKAVKRSVISDANYLMPLKTEAVNYQSEGEAYLRNKRQNGVSTESTDIVKGLESSGELTVSGNKSPLASSNEESDLTKAKVTKKSTNDKAETKDYDLELEKNIQEQIKAIKEQVKREIEALKTTQPKQETNGNNLKRKKREVQNTLMDEEKNFLDPKIDEESLKPHKRNKRDFDNDVINEYNDCSTGKSIIEQKRNVNIEKKTDNFNKNLNEELKSEIGKKSMDYIKYSEDDKAPVNEEVNQNSESRAIRHAENMNKNNEVEASLAPDLESSISENNENSKNLKSRSNNKETDKEEENNDELSEENSNENKDSHSENMNEAMLNDELLQKRTSDDQKKQENEKEKSNKSPSHAENVKHIENRDVDKEDTDDSLSDKTKRSKENKQTNELNKAPKPVSNNDNEDTNERKKRKEQDKNQLNSEEVNKSKRQMEIRSDQLAQHAENEHIKVKNENAASIKSQEASEKNDEDFDEVELKKRSATPDAIETNLENLEIHKRQPNPLYVEDKFQETDDIKTDGNKYKRNEEIETNSVKIDMPKLSADTDEKRERRNEKLEENNLENVDKHGITISDVASRKKRNEDPDKHSDILRDKRTELEQNHFQFDEKLNAGQKVDKRTRRNEESDQMSEGVDELKTERKKRENFETEIKNKGNKILQPESRDNIVENKLIKRHMQSNLDNSKIEKKRNIVALPLIEQSNEDDENAKRKRREAERKPEEFQYEERQTRSIKQAKQPVMPDFDDSQLKESVNHKKTENNRKRRHTAKKIKRSLKQVNVQNIRVKRHDTKETNDSKMNSKAEKVQTKKSDKSAKNRRDVGKSHEIKATVKQRDLKEQLKNVNKENIQNSKKSVVSKRKIHGNNNIDIKNQMYLDPLLFHARRKRSNSLIYYPYREEDEEVDDEGDEFDDDGFEDRTSNFVKKRETNNEQMEDEIADNKDLTRENENHITKRQSLLHDYVANMNSDTYETPNEYLYERASPYNRNKRQDFDDEDFSAYNEQRELNNRRSIKREIDMEGVENKKSGNKLDESMLGLSDSDLFGSLPQSYEGELSRFKRVRRNINHAHT